MRTNQNACITELIIKKTLIEHAVPTNDNARYIRTLLWIFLYFQINNIHSHNIPACSSWFKDMLTHLNNIQLLHITVWLWLTVHCQKYEIFTVNRAANLKFYKKKEKEKKRKTKEKVFKLPRKALWDSHTLEYWKMTTLKKSRSISTQNNIQMRSDERQIFFGVVIALYFLPTGQGNTIFLRDLLATNFGWKNVY